MGPVKKQGGPLEKQSESSGSGRDGKYARRKSASREKALVAMQRSLQACGSKGKDQGMSVNHNRLRRIPRNAA